MEAIQQMAAVPVVLLLLGATLWVLRRDLPAWFIDPAIEQTVESAVEHGEQNSHISLAPQQVREILNRISARIQQPERPVVAITSSGARYYLRQIAEPALPNLFFLAHNEVPPGLRLQSLGNIQ